MVDIDAGNVYITSGSVSGNTITGGTTVCIQTTKLDYNLNNSIVAIPKVVTPNSRDTKTPYTIILDLKKIEEVITITGYLIDESGESAIKKRDYLLDLAKNKGSLSVVWGKTYGTNSYQTLWTANSDPETNTGVFISKMQFTETVGYMGTAVGGASDQEPSERNIAVSLSLMRGKDV